MGRIVGIARVVVVSGIVQDIAVGLGKLVSSG